MASFPFFRAPVALPVAAFLFRPALAGKNLPLESRFRLLASDLPRATLFALFFRGELFGGPYVNSKPQLGQLMVLTVLGPLLNDLLLAGMAKNEGKIQMYDFCPFLIGSHNIFSGFWSYICPPGPTSSGYLTPLY